MTKCFLLGAGLGTRLQPLTDVLPKPLTPVVNRPLISHAIKHCNSIGIDSFAINTHHLPNSWNTGKLKRLHPSSSFSLFFEKDLLETGGDIKNISSFIGEDNILIYNGDLLTDIDIAALIAAHEASNDTVTLALRSSGPNKNVALEGDRVVDMRHSLGIHPGTHQFTGIYCISAAILDLIPGGEKLSIVPAFLELAGQGKLGGIVLDEGHWLDLGDRESYLDAQLEPVHQEKFGPAIHPGARIDSGARLQNCVVGDGARIEAGAELSDCVVWPDSHILADARLSRCIVYSSKPASGSHHGADL